MPDMLNGNRARADVVEWRLARPEDGPVWVALTREGRLPVVPREALMEPDLRLLRDQQEQQGELVRFVDDPLDPRERRYLLWRSNRPLGRLCFAVRDARAQLEGIALLPSAGREVIEQVARAAVERAQEAGARLIRAAYEARHAPAFVAAGFQEVRRYTPMMAATRLMDEDRNMVNALYHVRLTRSDDTELLTPLLQDTAQDGANGRHHSPTDWLADWAQLLVEPDDGTLSACSAVAELRQRPRLVGVVQVGRWQGAALINNLYVLPRYRQRGIATALVRRALQELHERGYVAVMLVVAEGDPIQDFYRRLGFREVQLGYVEGEYTL